MDLQSRRIIDVVEGKSIESMRPFFEWLKQTGNADQIESVSVDMNAAYPRLVQEYLPNAKLAYDRFHVMQHFTDVIKEAKISTVKKLKEQQKACDKETAAVHADHIRLLSSSEWLVVVDPAKLNSSRAEQLEKLRDANALFRDIYPLAAQIKAIWTAGSTEKACELLTKAIDLCNAVCEAHDFKPLAKFARMLKRRQAGIVNACNVGYGTNILEGANNTAKVIKRVMYGLRSFTYFALKLKGAFPGSDFRDALANAGWTLTWNKSVQSLVFHH